MQILLWEFVIIRLIRVKGFHLLRSDFTLAKMLAKERRALTVERLTI